MATNNGPVEKKVKSGTWATGIGVTVLLAILGGISSENLVAVLPDWLVVPAGAVITAAITYLTAYNTDHTPRPDLRNERGGN